MARSQKLQVLHIKVIPKKTPNKVRMVLVLTLRGWTKEVREEASEERVKLF